MNDPNIVPIKGEIEKIHVPISKLRQDLKDALEHYDRIKAYHTAVAVQQAAQALERFFENERTFFAVLDGDSVPDPKHSPPKAWKVINGGKDNPLKFGMKNG